MINVKWDENKLRILKTSLTLACVNYSYSGPYFELYVLNSRFKRTSKTQEEGKERVIEFLKKHGFDLNFKNA